MLLRDHTFIHMSHGKMASLVEQWVSLDLFTDGQGSVPPAESPTHTDEKVAGMEIIN